MREPLDPPEETADECCGCGATTKIIEVDDVYFVCQKCAALVLREVASNERQTIEELVTNHV